MAESDSQKIAPLATSFVVEHKVPTASKEAFLGMEKSLEEEVAKRSGCLSVRLEERPSDDPQELHYRTTMVFKSQESLLAWVDSDVRHDLIAEARQEFPYGYALKARVEGFAPWFPAPQGTSTDAPGPPAWKFNLLVLLTLYPTVMALGPILKPISGDWPLASAMLLGNCCSVSITGWLLIPLANKLYSRWLHEPHAAIVDVVAPLSAVALLALVWFLCLG